jgi:peptide/nickel transport system permease protein
MTGMTVIAFMAVVAAAAPLVAPFDPLDIDVGAILQGPSLDHLLGTDELGRDVLSRLVYGSRLSLGTAALTALIVMVVGVSVGLLAGLRGGWVDSLCMRVVDGLLAFPSFVLVLAVAGTLKGGLLTVVVGFAAVSWAGFARMVRGLVLQVRERPYVMAARAIGASQLRVGWRHVLPNVIGPVLVLLSLEIGNLIAAVSALSFLGVGAQPPTPEWGAMLNEARDSVFSAPHLMIFPGAALTLAVLGCNLLAEGVRDLIDPKSPTGPRPSAVDGRRRRRDGPPATTVNGGDERANGA